MKKFMYVLFIGMSMLTLLFEESCTKSGDIDKDIMEMERLDQPEPMDEPEPVGEETIEETDEYICSVQKYQMAAEFNEHIALDPTTDVIWPGALIDGESIPTGEYTPITAKRGPLTFSISLENIEGDKSKTVEEAKLSSIREAVGEILAQDVTGATPAKVSFAIEDVYSEEQLKIAVGAHYSSGMHSVEGQFDFSNTSIRSRILAKFIQVYYTLDIDIPEKPSDFFAESVTWDDLKNQITGDTSPMYVSTVTYGRMALFSVESTESSTNVKAAIEYSYNGIMTDAGVSVETEYKNILNNSQIKATILGGSGAEAVGAINGFEGLKDYILTGGNYDSDSPGAPLSYKLRYLSDNSIGNIVLSSEYTIRNCRKKTNVFKVTAKYLECTNANDNDSGGDEDLYGDAWVRTYTGDDQEVPGDVDSNIWHRDSSQNVSLGTGDISEINQEIRFTIENPDLDLTTAYIELVGHLWENDPSSADDDLGEQTKRVYLSEALGEFKLQFQKGSSKAEIVFGIEPL